MVIETTATTTAARPAGSPTPASLWWITRVTPRKPSPRPAAARRSIRSPMRQIASPAVMSGWVPITSAATPVSTPRSSATHTPPRPIPWQQQADHRHVHVVEPPACPRGTQSNCGNREQRRGGCEAQGEEPHRPRVRHRDRDHQVAGAPQEHEQRREQGRSIHLHLLSSRAADFTGAGSAVPVPRPRHAAAGRVAGIRESRAILRHCARDFTDEGRAAWRPITSCV